MARLVDKSKVTQGKTTIPQAIRTMYKIEDGDDLEWYEDGREKIIVKKDKNRPLDEKR